MFVFLCGILMVIKRKYYMHFCIYLQNWNDCSCLPEIMIAAVCYGYWLLLFARNIVCSCLLWLSIAAVCRYINCSCLLWLSIAAVCRYINCSCLQLFEYLLIVAVCICQIYWLQLFISYIKFFCCLLHSNRYLNLIILHSLSPINF